VRWRSLCPWRPSSRDWRSERGATGVEEVVTAGVLAVIFVFGFLFIAAATEDLGEKKREAGRASAATVTFIGPGPPPGAEAECVRSASERAGVVWLGGNMGWRKLGGDDEPKLVDFLAPNKKLLVSRQEYGEALDNWIGEMTRLKNQALQNIQSSRCTEPLGTASPPPNPEILSIFGTYYLKGTGGSLVPECSTVLPPSLSVSPNGNNEFNVAVAGHGEIPGKTLGPFPLSSNPTFAGDDPPHYWTISGGFIQRSAGIVVTGTFTYSIGGGCGIDFEGTTTPP
jgi:hypothetical protein